MLARRLRRCIHPCTVCEFLFVCVTDTVSFWKRYDADTVWAASTASNMLMSNLKDPFFPKLSRFHATLFAQLVQFWRATKMSRKSPSCEQAQWRYCCSDIILPCPLWLTEVVVVSFSRNCVMLKVLINNYSVSYANKQQLTNCAYLYFLIALTFALTSHHNCFSITVPLLCMHAMPYATDDMALSHHICFHCCIHNKREVLQTPNGKYSVRGVRLRAETVVVVVVILTTTVTMTMATTATTTMMKMMMRMTMMRMITDHKDDDDDDDDCDHWSQ
jgi:hypothetical protein